MSLAVAEVVNETGPRSRAVPGTSYGKELAGLTCRFAFVEQFSGHRVDDTLGQSLAVSMGCSFCLRSLMSRRIS